MYFMLSFNYTSHVPKDFTGCCKITSDDSIRYFKDGELHREDGPACIHTNGALHYYLNGQAHREDGPSHNYSDGVTNWFYKGKNYGIDDEFTNESWIEFIKELKREEELKIFL